MDLKIGIGLPSAGEWKAGFGTCLADMVQSFSLASYEGGRKGLEIIGVTGHLPEVRHRVVAEAVKAECTHLLWLDCDMIVPRDTVQHLLARLGPDVLVVGANYVRRTIPSIPVAWEGPRGTGHSLYTTPESTGLVEVKHTGMGCLLTDMRVYDAIGLPWFAFEPIPPLNVKMKGEDVYFCEKLAAAGIKTWVDQDLSKHIGHCGEMVYTHSMAHVSREEQAKIANEAETSAA